MSHETLPPKLDPAKLGAYLEGVYDARKQRAERTAATAAQAVKDLEDWEAFMLTNPTVGENHEA